MTGFEKRIDTFRIEIEGMTYEVPLYMVKPKMNSRYDSNLLTFRAVYEPLQIDLHNSNINELKAAVQKEIENQTKIKWELVLQVSIVTVSNQEETSVGFKFKFFKIGNRPDGKRVHVEVHEPDSVKDDGSWDGKWDPDYGASKWIRDGDPDEGEQEHFGDKDMIALLPATPENVKAAKVFDKMLEDLGKNLFARFQPGFIKDTFEKILARVNIPALPPIKKTKQ